MLRGLWLGMLVGTAAADPGLTIVFDHGNPPSMWGEAGTARGYQPALLTEAARLADLKVRMQAMPWPRALAAAEAGEACVGGAYSTSQRRQRYQFSEVIWTERIVAVSRVGGPATPVASWEDLRGQVVGLHRGWSYGEALDQALAKPELKTVRMTYGDRLFMALQAGKLDVVLTDADSATFEARRLSLPITVRGVLGRNTTHVMCPQGPQFAAALQRLNTGLLRLHEQGRAAALVDAQLKP